MSSRYPGGVISKTPVTPTTSSAPGFWTLEQASYWIGQNQWPTPSNPGLYSWGYNNNGQLGLGNTTDRSSPTQVGALTTWLRTACGVYHTVAIHS